MPPFPRGWRMELPEPREPRARMSARFQGAIAAHLTGDAFANAMARELAAEAACTNKWTAEALEAVGGPDRAGEYKDRVLISNHRGARSAGFGSPMRKREYEAVARVEGQGTANVELQLEQLRQTHQVMRAQLREAAPPPRLAHPEHNSWFGSVPNTRAARAPRPPRSAFGPYFGAN